MEAKTNFLRFARSVVDHGERGLLTIKHREKEGIVALRSDNQDYAHASGRTNSGVTFKGGLDSRYWNDLTPEQYTAWKEHLADSATARTFMETLAAENGIYVCLSGTKIQALTRDMQPGRTIYNAVQ